MPLGKYHAEPTTKKPIGSLKKNTSAPFPLVDYFLGTGQPDTLKWINTGTEKSNRVLVFNAINASGNAYTGNEADALTSKDINLANQSKVVFLSFSWSKGSTYSNADSLVLFGRDNLGVWQPLWNSQQQLDGWREVMFNLPENMLNQTAFALKFQLYSNNQSLTNTSSFLINKLVLSVKPELVFYDNVAMFEVPDSVPLRTNWNGEDTHVELGKSLGFPWGYWVSLDMQDGLDSVYANADNSYGGGDTLFVNPMDIIGAKVADSIFFSFMVRPGALNAQGDSLIVEFKNNLGNWVRVIALPGTFNNQNIVYTQNVNFGRNRHGFFQPRFIIKSQRLKGNNANWLVSGIRLVRRIDLPLFDDFSDTQGEPSASRWLDKDVFVNNDFPVNAPSVNVATFDGLNALGAPYSTFALKGICDKLTSASINLSQLKAADSVILSLYYQYEPQGTTDQVYPDDSLIIEARSSRFDPDSFFVLKMISANDTLLNKFNYYSVALTNPAFFHDDFQLRIKNKGSLTGNLSQWHVDYIRFNKGRFQGDPIKDISLTNAPRIYLGEYSSMPWNHYVKNKSAYRNAKDTLGIKNHDNQSYSIDYFRSVIKPEGDTLDKFVQVLGNLAPYAQVKQEINKTFDFATALVTDSIIFDTRYRVKISGTALDNVPSNDQYSVKTFFSNFFAYDDGTAEGGYGIKNKPNAGACLKYKVEEPDSIVGIYVFFNRSEQDVSQQRFNLKIWKTISPLFEPANNDQVLLSIDQIKPTYTNSRNGFTTYRLPKAVAVTDSFYIGWDQTNSFVLNIGLDKNYPPGINPNMAYKMDGRWYPTEIPGALMIRPIMGKFLGAATSIETPEERVELTKPVVYPNPAKDRINIGGIDALKYHIKLISINGAEINGWLMEDNTMLLPSLTPDVYLLILENKQTQQRFVNKIIIQP